MGDMETDIRTHHIHIVKRNGTEWKNYIHFGDYLNINENVVLQYENLKKEMESKSVIRNAGKDKVEDKMWNRGRERWLL